MRTFINSGLKSLLLSTFLFLMLSSDLFAQKNSLCPPSQNKTSVKHSDDARSSLKSNQPIKKIREDIDKALSEDSTNADAWLTLANAAYKLHDDKIMAQAYEKLIEYCPDASSDAYYRLANYQYESKEFDKAITNFQSFLDFGKVKEENARDASQKIVRAKLMKNPVPFNPVPLKNVSGGDPEYLAVISPDQDYCFFTRRFEELKRGALTPVTAEKFMISKKTNGEFDSGQPMPLPFNKVSNNNEGGASVSIDNKHLYFTVNRNGNFDVYTSDDVNGKWSEPRSIGENVNDPKQWDSQPSISSDGKTLYFASFRDEVKMTSDIMVTRKNADGSWAKPIALPDPINSEGNEKTPFIHPDNKTLYFSTDNLPGMGGYDIWMCKLKPDGSWGTPVNLGYPINTEANELGFFVSTDGKKGYFSSDQLKGNGGYDIFEFDLPQQVRPDRVLFLKGDLKDEKNAPINAKIELKNTNTQEIIDVDYDTISGRYASVVAFDDDYILTVKKKDYAFNSTYFSKEDTSIAAPITADLRLKKTEIGEAYRLNNIHFTINSSEMNKQDQNIISDFAEYLKLNPKIKVAIHGHTDNDGNPADNLILSEQRAHAVFDFLATRGIDKTRLSYKGFGETKPLSPNTTTEGKARNRRTEFVIIAK